VRSSFLRSLAVDGPALAPQTRLGSYEIISLLGAGGMGEVYRARDLKLGRDVALKVLPAETAEDPDRLNRFQREARAVATLNHPHIVTIHSVEEAGGTHFLTMELVEGVALSHLIPRGGLPLDKLFELAIPLADALAAAHEKGIVHRDLKPANVMVDKRGSVKILDFGLAKIAGSDEMRALDSRIENLSQTQTGMMMGTLPYMSPEQAQGRSVDHRSDLFSIGAVLYEMASGQPPFQGETSAELMSSILQDSPRPITELRTDVPLGLERILERCLAKEIEERYASAQDLRDAVDGLRRDLIVRPQSVFAGSAGEASIAILPFTNMSTDPESEFFADGISEEIINALAQIELLHVVAPTSASSFKGKQLDLRVIGERLNVRTVLTGSVRRAGNRLRITAELQKVADGYQLWSERYDRELKDVFDIQEEIARSIVDRLKISLGEDRPDPLVKARTKNLEAYELYLKGRALLFERGLGIPQALECFNRAVALDAEYALAWAGLSDAYTVLGYYGWARPDASMPKATEAARRSVALDPSLADGHNALACARLLDTWDNAEAEREFLRALELSPRYTQARAWYAFFYLGGAVDRWEEGVHHAKLAVESDPLSGYANAVLGCSYILAGRYAEAVTASQRAAELDTDSFLARWTLHCSLHGSGRFEEAVAVGEMSLTMSGRHAWAMAALAATFADWGKPADAGAVYAELRARAQRYYVQPTQLAIAATAAGMHDEAIRQVREAFEIRDPSRNMLSLVTNLWPFSARLLADPSFREIILKNSTPSPRATGQAGAS
jgi:serine/threonine protein kinase/tetratricopeptide (TPR) repeat protein